MGCKSISHTIQIGIDPGTQTGLAIAENGRLRELHTVPIHRAMKIVDEWQTRAHEVGFAFVVYHKYTYDKFQKAKDI